MPILLFLGLTLLQQAPESVVDLRGRCLQYDGRQYLPLDTLTVPPGRAVFFGIDPSRIAPKSTLVIRYKDPVFVFVDGTYAGTRGSVLKFDLDSLASSQGTRTRGEFIFCVRPVEVPQELTTRVGAGTRAITTGPPFEKRSVDFFGNLITMGVLLILGLLAAARQVNEKLLHAYFSVRQLILRRDMEEMQQMNEARGSSNLLFYMIAALMVSFVLLLIFNISLSHAGLPILKPESLAGALGEWGKLALLVLIFFVVKWALTVFVSWLFHVTEMVRPYYFNWMRVVLLIVSILLVIVLGYYTRTEKISMILNFRACLFLMSLVWIAVLFHKLRWRVRFSLFHIISYICTIELIPLLILSEVF